MAFLLVEVMARQNGGDFPVIEGDWKWIGGNVSGGKMVRNSLFLTLVSSLIVACVRLPSCADAAAAEAQVAMAA